MDRYVICGGERLSGQVKISGAKNAVLPILAGTLMTKNAVLKNVPNLSDVAYTVEILENLGMNITIENDKMNIINSGIVNTVLPTELCSKMRSSILLMGGMLASAGEVTIPYPGGCSLGSRPIDIHLKAVEKMGVEIAESSKGIYCKVRNLQGTKIKLPFPSVGATENIMLAGVLAKGETTISNCAIEPEIVDLAKFLNSIGAKISGAGTDTIVIKGVNELGGCCHRVIPDRIEAGTFMIAVAGTGGNVKIQDVIPEQLRPVISKLKEADVEVKEDENSVTVCSDGFIANTDIKTMPYPGFPTDMQAQFMGLMCGGLGTGIINETVFENRFMQVPEFIKMGADITIEGRCAVVKGVETMKGAKVRATDLRAGAGLVITGLGAEGVTEITDIHYIDRGYENFDGKLRGIGADIIRINEQAVQ